MKKLLIVLLLVAIGVGAYQFLGGSKNMERLDYVPADTVMLSAQMKPLNMTAYLASMGMQPGQYDQFSQLFDEMMQDENDPVAKFGLAIFNRFFEAIAEPQKFVATTGMKDAQRSLVYFVGASPVMHFELDNEAQFLSFFSDAQASSGISYADKTIDGVAYVSYLLDEELGLELLVRAADGWGVMTFHAADFDDEHLKLSLAISKPSNPLAGSDIYKKMFGEYKMSKDGVGFISTQELGKMFSTADGNALAKDINILGNGEIAREFEMLRTPECKADIDMLTAMWPGMFIDTTINQSAGKSLVIDGRVLIPTSSEVAKDGLKALRGFLPNYSTSIKSMISVALGLDVSALSSSVSSMWSAASNMTLTCEPLLALQAEMQQNNPTGAFAMAGVANGFYGVAAAINEFEFDMSGEGATSLDAVVSVSAENVQALYASLQTFVPFLAQQPLPAEGEVLNMAEVVPMLSQFGVEVFAKANSEHLVLYSGVEGTVQADDVLSQSLTQNGLNALKIDYGKFFEQMLPIMQMSGQPIPPELEGMLDTKMVVSMSTDVDDTGIVFKTTMQMD